MAEAEMSTSKIPDAPKANWLDRFAPAWLVPYGRLARWDRPIGWWLLLWPCWWAAALAAVAAERALPDLWHLALFLTGAIAMRGAGCTYNDIVDRDIDARVARTAARPIPSGAVSVRRAWLFLALQLAVGLAILLALAPLAVLLGVGSLALIAAYPFMKRVTYWPQAFLGLTFNWGALMGWAAATGRVQAPALALYAAGIAWTLVYDTIYAHQDKEDDALIGVKSTALRFGARTKPWLAGFAVLAVVLWAAAADLGGLAWPGAIAVGLVGLHLAWQIGVVDLDDPADCLAKFRANRWIGWILLAGVVGGRWAA